MTLLFALLLIPLLIAGVYDEHPPDYYKPYAPISFDKQVYSWTDKVHITIAAPAWNADTHAIDVIGGDSEHAIKISTPSHSLNMYELAETSPNSGVFTGEVTLTGFAHDVDGDGKDDTTPRTNGNGPTGGFLETKRDDGITLSFEFADGVVLTKSAHINWNVGDVEFNNPNYLENDHVIVRIIDPDMNLNPETLDDIQVDVSSDSDSAGVTVTATETDDSSGIFEAVIILTQSDESSGNRLRALSGDTITATYQDRTLPKPYSVSDELEVVAKSAIDSDLLNNSKVSIDEIFLADSQGNKIDSPTANNQMQIITHIQNPQQKQQNFVNIIQVTDKSGVIVSLSWVSGILNAAQQFEISQSWTPQQKGQYKVETFVWKSLDDTEPISQNRAQTVKIQ